MWFLILLSMLMVIICIPVYADSNAEPNPANMALESPGNSSTGEGEIVMDTTTGFHWQAVSGSMSGHGNEAGMSGGKAEGGTSESNTNMQSGETQTAIISGSTPTSYTVTREKVGETQVITRTDGTPGTRETYEIPGKVTQIVNTYEDGSEITTSFNSDGTTITTTNGQTWREWHNTDGSSGNSSGSSDSSSSAGVNGSNESSGMSAGARGQESSGEPSGGATPISPGDDPRDPVPGERDPDPSNNTNLYEFKHDNATDGLRATGTTKDADGRELQLTVIIPPVNPLPKPEYPEIPQNPENPQNPGNKENQENHQNSDGQGNSGSSSQSDGANGAGGTITVDGKKYPINTSGTTTTTTGTPGSTGEDVYQRLQEFTKIASEIENGKTITSEKPGTLTITQEFKDGSKKTWTVTAEDEIEFDYPVTKEDEKTENTHFTVTFGHDIEYRPTFVGYDWVIENLTDQYSPFYRSPTSFTTPGMTERQYEGGPIDSGGLLPVGEGYIKQDCHGNWSSAEDYWFVNYGDHVATVTPWWNVDVYEHWIEHVESNGQGGQDGDSYDIDIYEYLDSYKESREPRVFKFNIGLVCLDCPIPAKGYRVCLGGNCDCDGTGNELMTVCDENHTGELDIENRVELEQ